MIRYYTDELIIGTHYYTSPYKNACFIYEGRDGEYYKFSHVFSTGNYKRNSNGFYYFGYTTWYLDGFKYGR